MTRVSTRALLDAVKKAAKAAERDHMVSMRASGNELEIAGISSKISVVTTMEVKKRSSSWQCAVSADRLVEFLSIMEEPETELSLVTKGALCVQCGVNKATIRAAEAVLAPLFNGDAATAVNASSLKRQVMEASHALGDEKTSRLYASFHVEIFDRGTRVTACAGTRLSVRDNAAGEFRKDFVCFGPNLRLALEMLDEGSMQVAYTNDGFIIKDAATEVRVGVEAVAYFCLDKLATSGGVIVEADRLEMLQAMLVASQLETSHDVSTRITAGDGQLNISCRTQEGSVDTHVRCVGAPANFQFRTSAKYLSKVLASLGEEKVRLEYEGAFKPLRIREDGRFEMVMGRVIR